MKKIFYFQIFLFIISLTLFSNLLYSQQWVLAGFVPDPGIRPSIGLGDANNVYITDGFSGAPKIFKTTNGGINWESCPTTGISQELYCLWVQSNRIFVGEGEVNGNARMFLSSDEGNTWNIVCTTPNNRGFFNGIVFPRLHVNIGLAVAERIYRTTDGGYNWVELSSGVNGVSNAQNSLFIIDNYFYGFGMNNGAARIRVTTDNASSWSNQNINISGNYTCAIAFNDDKLTGVAATSSSLPYISRTIDGGYTWSPVNIGTGVTGTCKIKWISGTSVVYIVGENGGIMRSLDNGQNWSTMTTAGVTGITHFDFLKINNIIYGYAVSSNGNVIKLADSILIITAEGKNFQAIPQNYKLEQNYPNPFNPATIINYELSLTNNVKLTIYDILGKELEILVNKKQNAGKYQVKWDASKYPSGIYLCKIQSGDFTETKKMTLIK